MADTDLFLALGKQIQRSPTPPKKGGVARHRSSPVTPALDTPPKPSAAVKKTTPKHKPTNHTELQTVHTVHQSVGRSVSRPVDQPVDQQLTGKVIDRPVAFYLPEVINDRIDEAVDYFEKRHRVKVDRSAVVSAILGNPAVWEPAALNQLVDKVIHQLTSRLTSRLTKQ